MADTAIPAQTDTTPAENPDIDQQIESLQREIFELQGRLQSIRAGKPPVEVPDYRFDSLAGAVRLSELFGDQDDLLMIHNMGQACRYCTLWGDALDGAVDHLESALALVMVSKDSPEQQRRFARSRGWRFRMVSHGGGDYMAEQVAVGEMSNMPGVVHYERRDGAVYRRAGSLFGPGDPFCPVWHFLALAGIDESRWTPQYSYWQGPGIMEDGGANLPGEA